MHYNVAPRFTCGSPAAVDRETALRVAQQEKRAYEQALTGAYGEEDLKKAQALGLRGIVESRYERKGGWDVEDLITGQKCRRDGVRAGKLQIGDRVVEFRTSHKVSGTTISKVAGSEIVPFTIQQVIPNRLTVIFETDKGRIWMDAEALVTYERDVTDEK